jgi:hypothetical protein
MRSWACGSGSEAGGQSTYRCRCDLGRPPAAIRKSQMWVLGNLRFDPVPRVIPSPSGLVHLPPREADLLLVLVEAGGEIVTKADLMSRVWAGSTVEQGNLTQQNSLLRRVPRADGRSPHLRRNDFAGRLSLHRPQLPPTRRTPYGSRCWIAMRRGSGSRCRPVCRAIRNRFGITPCASLVRLRRRRFGPYAPTSGSRSGPSDSAPFHYGTDAPHRMRQIKELSPTGAWLGQMAPALARSGTSRLTPTPSLQYFAWWS